MSNDNTSHEITSQASTSEDNDGFADAMAAIAVVAFVVIGAVLWVSSQ